MTKSLEEVARAVGKIDEKGWKEFAEGVNECFEPIAEWWDSTLLFMASRTITDAEALWAESSGRLPMTENERRQAFLDCVLRGHDE